MIFKIVAIEARRAEKAISRVLGVFFVVVFSGNVAYCDTVVVS